MFVFRVLVSGSLVLGLLFSSVGYLDAQRVTWAKGFGSSKNDGGFAIAADDDGNAYMTGIFSGPLRLGTFSLSPSISNGTSILVAKFDIMGTPLWAKNGGHQFSNAVSGIALDSDDNAYIVGTVKGTAEFEGSLFGTATKGNEILTARFLNDGTFDWARVDGGEHSDAGRNIIIYNDTIYITGGFQGSASIGTVSISGSSFLAQLKKDGSVLDADAFESWENLSESYDMASDGHGNLYSVGHFRARIDYTSVRTNKGEVVLVKQGEVHGSGRDKANSYISKYKTDKGWVYVKNVESKVVDWNTYNFNFGGITHDRKSNSLYLSGLYQGDIEIGNSSLSAQDGNNEIYLAKFDTAGNAIWAIEVEEVGDQLIRTDVEVDVDGNVYLAGSFINTFSNTPVNSNGKFDAFLAKYNGDGELQWVQTAGGREDDYGYNLALAGDGGLFLTGTFVGDATLGRRSLGNEKSVSSNGGQDAFIMKIGGTPVSDEGSVGQSAFSVYPNPSNGFLNIELPSELRGVPGIAFEVLDALGRKVGSGLLHNASGLDMSDLEPGVYHLSLIRPNFLHRASFVIEE